MHRCTLADGWKLHARLPYQTSSGSRSSQNQKKSRVPMNKLLARIIYAHGGLDCWNRYEKVEATIVSGGGFFRLKGRSAGFRSASNDGLAARGALVCLSLRGTRSAHNVDPRENCHREARRDGCCGATNSQRVVCRPPDEHALGCASSSLLQRGSSVDLSHNTLSSHNGRGAGCRDRAMAGRRRNLARPARLLSGFD